MPIKNVAVLYVSVTVPSIVVLRLLFSSLGLPSVKSGVDRF